MRFALLLLITIASVRHVAQADQLAVTPRIGVLDPAGSATWTEGFRQGLRQAGYSDGNNLMVEWRRSAEAEGELQSAVSD